MGVHVSCHGVPCIIARKPGPFMRKMLQLHGRQLTESQHTYVDGAIRNIKNDKRKYDEAMAAMVAANTQIRRNTMTKQTKATKPTDKAAAVVARMTKTKPHGGKPGSARSNQSAKYAKGELAAKAKATTPASKPGVITDVKPVTSGGEYIAVAAGTLGQPGYKALTFPKNRLTAELAKLAVVGGLLKAVEQYLAANKPTAKLATGVTGHTAPQSAMAAAQGRRGAPKPAKAVAPPKATKTAVKAPKAAAAPRAGARGITVVVKDAATTSIRPGSDRYAKLAWMIKNKPATTADAVGKQYAPGKVLRGGCLAGMAKRGHIVLS